MDSCLDLSHPELCSLAANRRLGRFQSSNYGQEDDRRDGVLDLAGMSEMLLPDRQLC
jgi:hypothetical protein